MASFHSRINSSSKDSTTFHRLHLRRVVHGKSQFKSSCYAVLVTHGIKQGCSSFNKDEEAWSEVAREELKLVKEILQHEMRIDGQEEESAPGFEINNIRTQSITAEYLPRTNNGATVAKKTDLVIAFHPLEKDVVVLRAKSHLQQRSHMADIYTQRLPLAIPFEVSLRAVTRRKTSFKLGPGIELSGSSERLTSTRASLYPGFTIVGHSWALCISQQDSTGDMTVRGPIDNPNLGTGSDGTLFTLLAVLCHALR